MSQPQVHLSLLGLRVRDRVSGFTGVCTSVCFDLYGCIQGIINPGLQADGKLGEQSWFDVNRLEILSDVPVMNRPDFEFGEVAKGNKGAAEKPLCNRA
ncbi:hypothetical protein D3C76_775460 [compost metagenome]